MFWIFVRIPTEAILTNIKNIFYDEIHIKQRLSYILFCSLRLLYNSKLIFMATPLVRNVVVVMRVHCIFVQLFQWSKSPLHHACENNHLDVVKLLIQHKANVNSQQEVRIVCGALL